MRLEVGPAELHVVPGTPAAVVAQVFNTDDVINAYEIRVFGVDPSWVELERERLSLFPSSAGVVTVLVNVPEDYPAGPLQLGVEVTPAVDQTARQLGNVTLIVPPRKIGTMHVDPSTVLAGRKATFNLTFTNEGNAPLTLDLSSLDPEAKVTRVEIVAYREPYGDGIRAERFRRQFVGKGARAGFAPDRDIDAISGATISSRSMCAGVQRASVLLEETLAHSRATLAAR